jgi:hypothetical protein
MKYSSTERPSRKFDLIGRGMISPFGLATRPRMPAICRTCIMFPRAPEWTIIQIGLVAGKWSSISLATSLVACVQISMSSWRRSSSVIRPFSYWLWTFSALASNVSSVLAFVGGVTTSSIEIVTPERVAQWKPVSFNASSVAATSTFGYRSARSLTIAESCFLSTTRFT